jgi:Ring finger domain
VCGSRYLRCRCSNTMKHQRILLLLASVLSGMTWTYTIHPKKYNANHDMTSSCCICLTPVVSAGSRVQLHCGHDYHIACIADWLIEKRSSCSCPLCRFPVQYKQGIKGEVSQHLPIKLQSYSLRETDTAVYIVVRGSSIAPGEY